MKIIITEATINTVMNACQNLADTGTEEAARKVLDLLDLLYGQNLLEKSTYKDLTEATKVQHETGDYTHRFGGLNYMQTVTSYMSFERDWQRNRPLFSWRKYQRGRATMAELLRLFNTTRSDAICIITGDGVEFIDFDQNGAAFQPWWNRISPELQKKLVVERTPSGGYHVAYRILGRVGGNTKLACTEDGKTLIETRGDGGLCLCAPSPGYELLQGNYESICTLEDDERAELLDTARAFHVPRKTAANAQRDLSNRQRLDVSRPLGNVPALPGSSRPGDDFKKRGDVRNLLQYHGWKIDHTDPNGEEYWTRPGKDSGVSATLKELDGVLQFYVFSSNAVPFEPNRAYDPFAVYTTLEADGDYDRAARQLSEQGFGAQETVDLSRLNARHTAAATQEFHPVEDAETSKPKEKHFRTLRYCEMYNADVQYNAPVIQGLLREREILNVIAAPKVGKSWLALHLGLSIATGKKWLSFDTVQRNVLYVDNELHDNTHQKRTNRLLQHLGIDGRTLDTFMVETCRGATLDFNSLPQLILECHDVGFHPEVLILDAFYRMIPHGYSENDNAGITELYNLLDSIAQEYNTAIVLVHHTSKGTQAGKSVTDIGSGAGAMSRASDTHMTVTPHEDDGLFILDAVTRSWKQPDPLVLRKQSDSDPWFVVAEDQQVKRQSDKTKPQHAKRRTEPLSVDEFAEMYISPEGTPKSAVINAAMEDGISKAEAQRKISVLLDTNTVRQETDRKTRIQTLYRDSRAAPLDTCPAFDGSPHDDFNEFAK